jgi:hypothetical protein
VLLQTIVVIRMDNKAEITIRRASDFADLMREYKVRMDGDVVASVRSGQSVTVPVVPGAHSISLQIDWCGSEEIAIEAQPGEQLTFECGSNLSDMRNRWKMFFVIFFRRREYLWLRSAI